MAKREVTVVINGEEYVSKAAKDAGDGMDGFFGKTKTWAKGFADLKAGWDVVVGAATKLWGVVQSSFAALDEYAASQRKLEGTSKLTGVALGQLKDIAKGAEDGFKLSSVTANDFASEIAKLTTKAGDIAKSKDAMAAFLEIGAARGLSASETLKAVQQAILGIDEGTDKLFGKNPSVLYKEYADKIGVAAGKLTDQQKAQALLDATLTGGENVRGSYQQYLQTAAGQQEILSQKTKDAERSFAEALTPLRLFTLEMGVKLMPVLAPLARFIGGTLSLSFSGLGMILNGLYGTVGQVTEVIGRLTGKREWQEWGQNAVLNAGAIQEKLTDLRDVSLDTMMGVKKSTDGQIASFRALGDQATTSTDQVAAGFEKVKDSAKKIETAIKDYKIVLEKLPTVLTAATATDQIERQKEEFKRIREEFDRFVKSVEESPPKTKPALDQTQNDVKGIGEKLAVAARATLDLASAFGVVDDKTRRALENVISIGEGIAKFASGDKIEGAVQVVSALTSLLMSVFAGDPARKKLIADNTAQMERLRKELGNLSLNVTGETFAKTQAALSSVMGQLRGGRGAKNQADVIAALRAQGLGMSDLEKVAKEMGIRIISDSGALSVDGLKALLEAMGLVELGAFGQDFASQKSALTAGFSVNRTDERGQIEALFGLGSRFTSAFNGLLDSRDLAKSRNNLATMFQRFNAGGFSAAELGGFTGEEFLSFITDLIGRIDSLAQATNAGSAESSGSGITSSAGAGGGGSPGIAPETVQAVVRAMDTNLATILKGHTAFHDRIATATEGSYVELQTLNRKMDTLIAVTESQTAATDERFATSRARALLSEGFAPVVR